MTDRRRRKDTEVPLEFIAELTEFVKRIDESEFEPQIQLIHHVPRPRKVKQSKDAKVLLVYIPGKEWTPQ